ncbi:MAG: type II toxin-antitoxin system HicA family toxin [Candidatus Liptonbacteria bacterium]|nr:type II toxin-antitoxin system HicA family toxin [Candidatus Liptonbacteria bacterium]
MPKLPRIPSVLVIRALKRAGFYEHHQTGGHIQLKRADQPNVRVTIPCHRKDLTPKTLKSILEQVNLTVDEFIRFL